MEQFFLALIGFSGGFIDVYKRQEQILSIAVGAADTMMVSSAGEAAVSAVSLVDNVFVLLINLFAALATGGAVISGQYLGRRRPDVAQKAAEQLILFTAVFSVLILSLIHICGSARGSARKSVCGDVWRGALLWKL